MPKPIVNNKIIYQNVYGLVSKHDTFLSQGVREGDSPTFSNLILTGDATVQGNLYVEGNTTLLNTNVIEFEDNIVLLNRLETGSGVTLNQSGLEIERGTLENYRIVYNDSDQTFKVGLISNLQTVATRENSPLENGMLTWNNSTKRIESRNNVSIDISFLSTTNSTNVSSGSVVFSGGIGIQKDIWTAGKLYLRGSSNTNVIWSDTSNSVNINSFGDIYLTPNNNIYIPYNKNLFLGDANLSCETSTKNLVINSNGHFDFNLIAGKRIRIPNQIPITFSTPNERIYADSSNNMMIESGEDINLVPGTNRKVVIPLNIGLTFSNNNQQISANLNNDLSLIAGNNIIIAPGPTLDVRIPTDNGIKFGNSGSQRIVADSSDDLYISSASNIYLNATEDIHLPNNVGIILGNLNRYIKSTTSNLEISTNFAELIIKNSSVHITDTRNSENATTGSIWTKGGLGVSKTIYTEGGVTVDSNNSSSFVIKRKSDSQNILNVNSSNNSNIQIVSGNGITNPSIEITPESPTDSRNTIVFKTQYDNNSEYKLGRGFSTFNSGRVFTVNIPNYSDYANSGDKPKFSITTNNCTEELFSIETDTGNIFSKGTFGLSSTEDAVNSSTASFVVLGGLGVVKSIITSGDYKSQTNSTSALDIQNYNGNSIIKVNTQTDKVSITGNFDINDNFNINTLSNNLINSYTTIFSNTTDTTDSSNASVIISGGVSVNKSLRVSEISYFNTIDMGNTRITNLQTPSDSTDAATKAYVDLVRQGLRVKDSVQIASITNGNLNIAYNSGTIIDGYTLQQGDRILIKDQEIPSENGIYIVQDSGIPFRAIDFDIGVNVSGSFVFVVNGDTNGGLGWICNSPSGSDIVGTDSINFTQFTALGKVEAGDGLTKTFNRLDVNTDNISLEVYDDQLRIKNTALGTGMTGGSGSPLQTSFDQSHVTRIGTIQSGTWQGSSIQVLYGGTGVSRFTEGNILFGNGLNPIRTDARFFYDSTNTRLGLGTNQPTKNLHITNPSNVSILLNADSEGLSPTAKPEIIFSYTGDIKSYIGLSRTTNEYANNIYSQSLVISHDKLDTTSIIQFATQKQNRMTILANGNIGINTSNPTARLQVVGTFITTDTNEFRSTVDSTSVSNGSIIISGGVGIRRSTNIGGRLRIFDTTPSTNLNTGAVIVQGGLSIQGNQNSANVGNGGALTVGGGAAITGDLYVGGSINGSGSSSSTYAYLTLTSTDEAINLSTGSLITFGGITIQGTTNATSLSSGGTILTLGGASIGGDIYIGGNNNFYGYTNYFGSDAILVFYDNDIPRFSIDKESGSSNFSLSRYDVTGTFIETSFTINSTTGSMNFSNTISSLSSTQASIILSGGLSITCSSEATSISSGGGITLMGGMSINKNLLVAHDLTIYSTKNSESVTSASFVTYGGISIGKDAIVDGSLTVNQDFSYGGGGELYTLKNPGVTHKWIYFGKVNDSSNVSYCEIDFYNGTSDDTTYGLKVNVSINNTTCNVSHNYYGTTTFDNSNNIEVIVYEDLSSGFHVFTRAPGSCNVSVQVRGKTGERFIFSDEGNGTTPDGNISMYNINWTNIYTTAKESNLNYEFGNVTVQGDFCVADNFPVIGYNNTNTTSSRNLGIAFERFQSSNDSGTGELVTDNYVFFDAIPSQTSANSTQIKFSNLVDDTDEYYTGWWIKIASGPNVDQVRKIISYNGAQRVATINEPWTNQNPGNGDIVYFYNAEYISFYYNDNEKRFELIYNTRDDVTKVLTSYDFVDLKTKGLILSDTTNSNNVSDGSIVTPGGISIQNTTNASSSTSGGSLTSLGGASIRKTLYVGDNIAVGNGEFTGDESIHIKQSNATLHLENQTDSVSYIDFSETGTPNRFGIISDSTSDLLSITFSTTGSTPNLSNSALSITNSGYIGINTTHSINSPLTIQSGNLISSSTDDSYIGLIGNPTNMNNSSSGSRIVLYGNNALGSLGNIVLSSSNSGSIRIYTNNEMERFRIEQSGSVKILTTTISRSRTAGALIVSGGIAVSATENSSSFTSGGALTVAGGASFMKDIFIGGNIYVTGSLNSTGSSESPSLIFMNESNCTVTGYDNNKLLSIGQEAVLSFAVFITPTSASENCQFEFQLPNRDNGFATRSEFVATCTGYTDDEDLIPLFNILSVGVIDEARGLIKFQSISTGVHYFTIICRYTMS
jgi:hypothetical protein